jgi:hypothetical protein
MAYGYAKLIESAGDGLKNGVAYELRMPATEGEEMRTAAIIQPLR